MPEKNTPLNLTEKVSDWDLKGLTVSVQGVAYTGAENTSIEKVEITADEGMTWHDATILDDESGGKGEAGGRHSWVRFEGQMPVSALRLSSPQKKMYIYSRATDSKGSSQSQVHVTCHTLCAHLTLTMCSYVTHYVLICHSLCVRMSLTM